MLSKIEVRTRRGTILTLNMYEDESGYRVAKVEGLDPVMATLVSSNYAGIDGEQFQSARRGPRNVKISLDLEPDFENWTYTTLRQNLYSYLMPKSEVTLRFFMTSGLYLDIVGRVEELSGEMSEQEPTVDVSIMCFQPDFVDPRIITLTGNTVSDTTVREIEYPGTVESGIVFTLNANRSLTSFTLYSKGEDDVLTQLDFSAELVSGDKLIISSLKGSKGITLIRDGVSQSYLYGRSAQSTWIELFEGVNEFRAYAPGDPIPYELEYVVRYGGL